MDKATIDAMRAVVGGLDERARMAERLGHEMVHFQSAAITTVEFRNAAETLRDLVDEAAEQPQPQAKPDERDVLTRFVESLEDATMAAGKYGEGRVSIVTSKSDRSWTQAEIGVVIRAINGMMNSEPKQPALATEPTAEECLAAMNRAKHRGSESWQLQADMGDGFLVLSQDEFAGLGSLLISREKAAEAKGGA